MTTTQADAGIDGARVDSPLPDRSVVPERVGSLHRPASSTAAKVRGW